MRNKCVLFPVLIAVLLCLFAGCSTDTGSQSNLTFNENISADMKEFAAVFSSVLDKGIEGDVSDISSNLGIDSMFETVASIENEDTSISSITILGKQYSAGDDFSIRIGTNTTYTDDVWKIEKGSLLVNKVILLINDLYGMEASAAGEAIPYDIFDSSKEQALQATLNFREETEGNAIEGNTVSVIDPSIPLVYSLSEDISSSLLICRNGEEYSITTSDEEIYPTFDAEAEPVEWTAYTLNREYKAYDSECNTAAYSLAIEFVPNLSFYYESIAGDIISSIDLNQASIVLETAFNNVDWDCVITALAEEGETEISAFEFLGWMNGSESIILSQNGGSSDAMFTELVSAKTIEEETGDIGEFTLKLSISDGFSSIFSDGSYIASANDEINISFSGALTISISGTENIRIDLERYSISTGDSNPVLVTNADSSSYEIEFSKIEGAISGYLILDAKQGSNFLMVNGIDGSLNVVSLSSPDNAASVIIDGYPIIENQAE